MRWYIYRSVRGVLACQDAAGVVFYFLEGYVQSLTGLWIIISDLTDRVTRREDNNNNNNRRRSLNLVAIRDIGFNGKGRRK